MVSMCIIAQCL